jgi:ribosomal protein S27E
VQQVINSLSISNICVRESTDKDVAPFTHNKLLEKVVVKLKDDGPILEVRCSICRRVFDRPILEVSCSICRRVFDRPIREVSCSICRRVFEHTYIYRTMFMLEHSGTDLMCCSRVHGP